MNNNAQIAHVAAPSASVLCQGHAVASPAVSVSHLGEEMPSAAPCQPQPWIREKPD